MSDRDKKIKFGLRLKFIAFVVLIVVSMVLGGWYSLEKSKKVLKVELEKRGKTITENLAYNARYGVAIEDTFILRELVGGVINDEDVVYVIISDRNGKVLTKLDKRGTDMSYPAYLKEKALTVVTPTIISYFSKMERVALYDIAAPVESKKYIEEKGSVEFLDELSGLDEEVGGIRKEGTRLSGEEWYRLASP